MKKSKKELDLLKPTKFQNKLRANKNMKKMIEECTKNADKFKHYHKPLILSDPKNLKLI